MAVNDGEDDTDVQDLEQSSTAGSVNAVSL